MSTEIAEQITVAAPVDRVFAAVADVHRMARWSPECFSVWVWRRREDSLPELFIGWNRRAAFVWFTACRVVVAEPGNEFAFNVTTFGQPVARWGYRFAPVANGTAVTEYWQDQRNGKAMTLGRIFTGRVANHRPEVNREQMRATLARLKQDLEAT